MSKNTLKKLLSYGLIGMFAMMFFIPTISRAQNNTLPPGAFPTGTSGVTPATVGAPVSLTSSSDLSSGLSVLFSLNPAAAGASWIAQATINATLVFILTSVTGFLGIFGVLFDWAFSFSTVNFAQNIYNIVGINTAWQLIRDLANMSFIFILVFEGIRLMFGKGPGKKIVVSVIIAAILINFSLFFTELIIDASNVVTVSFYNIALGNSGAQPVSIPGTSISINPGLSYAIMNVTGMNSLFDSNKALVSVATGGLGYSIQLVFIIIFTLIAAFVMLAMTVLFMVRYLYFIFLLILSPFAYIASVIPAFKGIAKKYWDTLLGQCYFAPAFMILTLITLTVANSLNQASGGSTMLSMFNTPGTAYAGGLMNYFIVIGMLIYTMILSKKLATEGGLGTATVINTGMAWMGGAVFGGASYLGTRTFGKAASTMANDEDLKERARRGDVGAKMQLKTAQFVSKSSFDARNIKNFDKATKNIGVGSFGKGIAQKGYAGVMDEKQKDQNKKDKAYLESLKPSDTTVKQAKEDLKYRLNDTIAVKEEEHQKSLHLQTLDDEIAKRKKDIDYDKVERERQAAKDGLNMSTDARIASEKKVREYQNSLKNTAFTDLAAKRAIIDQLNKEQENLSALNKSVENGKELLAKKQELLSHVDEIVRIRNQDQINWVTPELRDLIATAGGTKANKALFGNGSDIPDVSDTYTEAVNREADRVGDKSFRKVIVYGPGFNKERANRIRKLAKQKSAAEVLKEYGKKAKEEAKAAGIPDDDDDTPVDANTLRTAAEATENIQPAPPTP